MAAVLLALPLLCVCSVSADPGPTQIVYRFDDHRYLTLTGRRCEGAFTYVDEARGIRTVYFSQFGRVFLPRFVHADEDGDFIFLPYSDISGFAVSKDHGRTFKEAHWVGTRPYVEEVKQLTVINRQAFIETKDGRLFMTSKPIGKHWGMEVIDPVDVLPNKVHRDYPEFQNLPTEVPEVKNYKGWTEMHCDPDR